jgi:hypothetical protein
MTQNLGPGDDTGISPSMTDDEVRAALRKLWWHTRWSRLEISHVDGRYGGYCVQARNGPRIEVDQALARIAGCPPVITALRSLIDQCGWQRLELIGDPYDGLPGGWCERADGSGVSLRI